MTQSKLLPSLRNALTNILFFSITLLVGLGAAELVLRVKNSDQKNYNIEMWRYSKLLKVLSANPNLGHEHRPGKSAKLEGVEIRINSLGMRGPEPDLSDSAKKKILFLGSSNTLGWGVPEEETMTSVLQKDLGENTLVMNAGIGNYNAVRYVTLFKNKLRSLHPDIVVVHYFVRDAEALPPGRNNFILRNSEVAAMVYHMIQQSLNKSKGLEGLVDFYRSMYRAETPGYQAMTRALGELGEMSKQDGFRVVLAMTPEIHQMNPYPFGFIHEMMRGIADGFAWTYVDLYEPMSAVPAQDLWAMPGDPHLNAKGHRLMAEALLPYLES